MCKQEVEDKFHFTTSCSYTSDEKEALFDHMKSDFNDMSNRDKFVCIMQGANGSSKTARLILEQFF